MTEGNVTKLPISKWQMERNRRGARTASCMVSDRYLKATDPEDTGAEEGHATFLSVYKSNNFMTNGVPDKKLCELVIPMEELHNLMRILGAE
ncbi:hypothetical protein [Maritalea mediterranea]|uniref:Uncharacterized protein n=1 Tax=Maritalea mediterranea TaxID=2909667 RepID=A0ABS9E8W8_9HYPH|nr:hypothetical protein [Maritalea mediterranea]MCF4098205.1 hypothetical protein [Maritalea mediterranea]